MMRRMAKTKKSAKASAKSSKKDDKGKVGKKLSKEAKAKLEAAQHIVEEEAAKATKAKKIKNSGPADFAEALRVGPGFVLADVDPASTPGFAGDRDAGEALLPALGVAVGDLQERLYAESKGGGKRSLLLVVQGMDTSGKGGIMRHVVGAVDPQGVHITAFKAPTAEERAHPFLWRMTNALPSPGMIGVFDRSQYEDVLIVRVHNLVPRAQWGRRYNQINTWEKKVAAAGTTIVKVMLHISRDEQKARLAERLANPEKHWKFNPGDLDERALWDDYQSAYQVALEKCSTDVAPWYVVPADKKWYARLAVMNLMLGALKGMDPQWPAGTFDVAEQQARLEQS
jgi:PPK2 family polyphosphate:nucleotide phosphotransferase